MFLPLFCCTPPLEKTEFHTLVEDIPDLQYQLVSEPIVLLFSID